MIGKRFGSRIKATVLSAVMTATVFISPAAYQLTQVSAADVTINHTFVTTEDESEDSTNKKKINVESIKGASKITFNFETTFTGEMTIGAYGGEISAAPWWFDDKQESKVTPKNGKCSFVYTVPTEYVSVLKTVGIGIWYPKDGTEVKLTTASTGGSVIVDPGDPDIPVTQNNKSGEWSFKDLGNGKAEISSTLTAEIDDQEMDYLLSAGYDEESYIDPDTGISTWEDGMPINAKKFQFIEFGLDDLDSIAIQSFNYTIESDEEMSKFMYGGGINVDVGTPADTEILKGKNGYWYNDQGEEDMELYGDLFKIDVNNGYNVTNAGSYLEIVWDVPKDVQPYVSKNNTDTVGIQFWYAQSANPPVGEEYAEVDEVRLKAASCTYTRTIEVPYNKTVNKVINKQLTPGSNEATNQYKFNLSELGLKNRDLVSAVKFNVSSSADLTKFTGGVGISVANGNTVATDGWYMPNSNITVLEPEKSFEIMWIIPESIRKDIDTISADGNLMFGAWYAGETSPTITLKSIDFYEFLSNEDDLIVEPEQVTITVGESKELDINVDGCTFVSSNAGVVAVDNGIVKGLAVGNSNIVIRTPEGQEKTINVKVNPAAITTVVTTTSITTTTVATTTTTPVTTVDPDDVIDWDKVMYGDVNIDEDVTIADVVEINAYLLDTENYPLNATAKENADCVYDHDVNTSDSALIMNYVAMLVTIDQLGPKAP